MEQQPIIYSFGPFRMDRDQGILASGTSEISLTPKAFETLLLLVERAGTIIAKEELISRLWPDSFVDENNLAQNISLVRKAIAAVDPENNYVQTVSRRGYRFVAPVIRLTSEPQAPLLSTHSHAVPDVSLDHSPDRQGMPLTRYARSGDVNIAYQIVGDGPVDIVFVMGWVSHLEMFWAEPSFASFLRRLASFSRLILLDKRGTGLSDSVPLSQLPTLEQRMDDLRAVMQAAGSRRAILIGVSEGGTMSCLFAGTYPEHTAGVVIIGGYARRLWAEDYPWGPTAEQRESFIATLEREWGGPVGINERAPSLANDPEFRRWWSTYLRMGASPGAAAALTRMNADIDIRQVLPSIRVPTLVIHRTDDQCLRIEEGRYIAERIPGAQFIELPGNDHLPFVGDQDSILDEIERFVTGLGTAPDASRMLATLLFFRIEGDRVIPGIERFDYQTSIEVSWFQGKKVSRIGEGLLAYFDGPARAIRCARGILDAADKAGISLAGALHTGECEILEGGIGGVAVAAAEKITQLAKPGEILVSNTVRDLVAGSGLEFTPRDLASLGDLGSWPLFTVQRDL